jgi:hypothetical protein
VCKTAHQVRVARLAAGLTDDESIEAAAGAILAAEVDAKTMGIHRMIASYIDALNESAKEK